MVLIFGHACRWVPASPDGRFFYGSIQVHDLCGVGKLGNALMLIRRQSYGYFLIDFPESARLVNAVDNFLLCEHERACILILEAQSHQIRIV